MDNNRINYWYLTLAIAGGILLAAAIVWAVATIAINMAMEESSESVGEIMEEAMANKFSPNLNIQFETNGQKQGRLNFQANIRRKSTEAAKQQRIARDARRSAEQTCQFWRDQVRSNNTAQNRTYRDAACARLNEIR